MIRPLIFSFVVLAIGCATKFLRENSFERELAANPDYVANVSNPLPATGGNPTLSVISWNVKHLGRELFDSAQASPILAGADIVTFQEVNTRPQGLKALYDIAKHLQNLTKERICVGLSEIPSESKERYGYIWKNSRISYVKVNGEILENCPDTALTIRLGVSQAQQIVREPAFGTFYFKPVAKQFVLASIHLIPTSKKPELEVEPLFETFKNVTQPAIVAGDFNLSSGHTSFRHALAKGFQPALGSDLKTSLKREKRELNKAYDNFWFRNIKRVGPPQVLNLYDIFTEKDSASIYKNFSDHCPILSQFQFQ